MHLNLNEKKTKITYIIGNKLKFLGFVLHSAPYNQLSYRNSRRIEKRKRIMLRMKALKENTASKFRKFLRTKITKHIAKKLNRTNKTEEKDHFINELSCSLAQLVNVNEAGFSNFRDLLRILEKKLADTILYDTNEKMKSIFKSLFDEETLNEPVMIDGCSHDFAGKDNTVISKSKLTFSSFARRFTKILQREGFQYSTNKKMHFNFDIRKFIKEKKIQFTYFPSDYRLPEGLKKKLYVFSSIKQKRGAVSHNYKILILHFWELQNSVPLESKISLEQSLVSKAKIKAFETGTGILMALPIQIRVD